MNDQSSTVFVTGPLGDKIPFICPETRQPLHLDGSHLTSDTEAKNWSFENGFADLVLGGRFEDDTDESCRCYEVTSNEHSTKHYWIPLFKKLFAKKLAEGKKPRLLSVGCGIGIEVDMLCEAGFPCYGVDNGNRTKDWPERKHSEGLLLANAMHLPFEDNTFDAVFCGCVFPHVGVVGDSSTTHKDYLEHRQNLANEMIRVLKPKGYAIACSPNRLFPFDIFHGRAPGSYMPQFNPPTSKFLLSIGDYRHLFTQGGCQSVEALPVEGFWGFVTMSKSIQGKILSAPIRMAFKVASIPSLKFMRPTPFIPWVSAMGVK